MFIENQTSSRKWRNQKIKSGIKGCMRHPAKAEQSIQHSVIKIKNVHCKLKPPLWICPSESSFVVSTIKNSEGVKC